MAETLILTFQAQLSSVMETVLKTAMYEVTRLVEDGFLEEVRHSKQEVESLRTRLEWAEGKLKDGGSRGRCVDCGRAGEDLSDQEPEERLSGLQYSALSRCGLKQEGGFEEGWGSCGQEEVESEQEGVKLTPTPSLIEESGFTEDDEEEEEEEEEELNDTLEEVFKEEDVPKPPCAVDHQRGWALSHDGGIGLDSLSLSLSESRERLQQDCEELWNPGMKQDTQPSGTHTYAEEDQRDTLQADTSGFHSVDPEPNRSALTHAGAAQNHNRESSNDYDRTKSRASPPWITCQLLDAHADVHKAHSNPLLGRDPLCPPESQGPRPQASDLGTVVIKQEIIVDSDAGEEEEGEEGLRSVMGPHSQYRVRPGTVRQNCITQGSPGQEVAKLLGAHPKVHTIPHPHQPIRKHPRMLPANTGTAATVSASQVANSHYRSPSTSKPAPPHPLQTVHPGDKRPGSVMFSRTSAQWVNVRAHQGSHPGRLLLRCNQCGKSFPHPSNLKAHQQTHTGERPFCCSLCGRSFTKLSNLKAHRRVHTGERPYSCTDCGKRFTQKCNLKRHQRIHTENDVTAF